MDEVEVPSAEAVAASPAGRFARLRQRISPRAAEAEGVFLGVLRYSALMIAGLVLVGAAFFLAFGAFQQMGRTGVAPAQVAIAAEDVAPTAVPAAPKKAEAAQEKMGISAEVRRLTLDVYRANFKRFERGDTKVTDQQIVDFVWTDERVQEFQDLGGQLHDAEGKPLGDGDAVMRDALGLVRTASATEEFRKRLTAFRDAKKVNVCNEEVRTRSRTVQGWDSYATWCSNWYESPMGCAATRTIEEPYTEKVCTMKYPDDLEAPSQQLAAAVQRYGDTARAKLQTAKNDAEEATARNIARKAEGRENWSLSFKLFLGFMSIMFLYLFVAMERHHRSLRALMAERS